VAETHITLNKMELQHSYPKISEEEIIIFEQELEISLPKEYKKFLLQNNGGQPVHNVTFNLSKNGVKWEFPINIFFGISEEDTSYELSMTYAFFSERIPHQLLPIADDGIGNKICIGIEEEYYNKIFLWKFDKESQEDEEPTFDNVEELAESFNEFLKYLKE